MRRRADFNLAFREFNSKLIEHSPSWQLAALRLGRLTPTDSINRQYGHIDNITEFDGNL
ncbi:MAG: hypothetical protein ACREM1_07905 [Longimicrobiales bacterium]